MENKSISKSIILSFSLLLGLFLLGFFIFKGLKTFSDKDRVVTVKGLAEMNMTATSAYISLNFSFSGDNLQEIIKQTEIKKNSIIAYLINIGYNKNDIKINNIGINDREKYYDTKWINGQQVQVKIDRYTITQSLTILSKDVKTTEDKSAQIRLDLVKKDLTTNINTNYSFPELNSIKPQLIAESTKNARIAGEQFANDSQAKLGKIKTASQGQITIAGEYYCNDGISEGGGTPKEPYIQKARVVSTIVFFLE
ncbi:MAG: SIMPL domain-containing protein [Paludibacter sp.]|nr:SIMPL domain-containing protein [Paludibacter sp.]